MDFEWDDNKAEYNVQKHGVSFQEASSVFYDLPLPMLIIRVKKTVSSSLVGQAKHVYCLSLILTVVLVLVSLAHGRYDQRSEDYMQQTSNNHPSEDELRDEYDETVLKDGVRGKHVQRLAAGSNVIRLAPDVAAAFPTEEAVNDALQRLVQLAQSSVRQAA